MTEWHSISSNALQRRLRGSEVLINYSEQHQDGNYQILIAAWIETNLPTVELERRIHAVWYQVRLTHPVIAVEVTSSKHDELEYATYKAMNNAEEAEEWARQTCFIVNDGRTVHDIVNQHKQEAMTSPGKQATLSLITSPRIGSAGLVMNFSHVLNAHNMLKIMDTCAERLVYQIASPFSPFPFVKESMESIQKRLPRSASNVYEEKFRPTEDDLNKARMVAMESAQRYSKKTIGIPINEDWQTRKSHMHNLRYNLDIHETKQVGQNLRKAKLTLTTAFYACICAAIAQLYSEGGEEGAHLLFSANARRWFETEGLNGEAPVSMSVVPASAWVDATEEEIKTNTLEGLISLAKKIAIAQEADLQSPHILGVVDEFAQEVTKNGSFSGNQDVPALGRPVLTSQGTLDIRPNVPNSTLSGTWLNIVDFEFGGRNTDPVVCFAAQSFAKEFRYYLLFDERFFKLEETVRLAYRVGALLRLFASSPSARL